VNHNIARRGALPHHEPSAGAHNAALLIDFDNVTMGIRSDLQTQLRRLLNSEMIRGKVAVQRAYADWRRYPQYIVPLSESSIDLIFAPAFGANKKNATDIRLAIDGLELVFTRPEIGTFILLSGDSDFSSLVLKLKEYGKYVIGVGIRESASDLLVQNCDEYYSYSELTGLSKEVDTDVLPRDPWEVAVEAVVRMRDTGDVMRSDRLKQVMQEIDPHFDEKDAGMNKFSKFVVEGARRGLLTIEKMENGQYQIDLGPEANARLSTESAPSEEEPARPRRKHSTGGVDRAAGSRGMTLASAFALLKRTLIELGAVGDESTDADTAREKMIELADDKADSIFDGRRFQRMLRQAHDASIVDVAKSEGAYRVKLRPEPVESPSDDEGAAPDAETAAPAVEAKPRPKRKRTTKKKTAATPEDEAGDASETASAEAKPKPTRKRAPRKPKEETAAAEKSEAPPAETSAKTPMRNPRYRSGSKGVTKRPAAATLAEAESGADEGSPAAPEEPVDWSSRRSLGGRGGSKSRRRGSPRAGEADGVKAEESVASVSEDAAVRVEASDADSPPPQRDGPHEAIAAPKASVSPTPPAARRERVRKTEPAPPSDDDAPAVDGGLLKRMTAAFQRAVLGTEGDEADRSE